jgi:hypothetical protein
MELLAITNPIGLVAEGLKNEKQAPNSEKAQFLEL